MCDSLVAVGADGVWFAKNSDREPGEAQLVELHPRARHAEGARLAATHVTIDQARVTHEVVLSRPEWMWGAEMGANEHGLAIGNEAVFTRVPVAETGLTGMDLLRLALERCTTSEEAVELIAWMLARHGQGGRAGYRNARFRYHNAFLIADPREAWLLETAGPYWAAERITRGVRTTSNVLTIGGEPARVGPGTIDAARRLLPHGASFDFRRAFADPTYAWLGGGELRRACTARSLAVPALTPATLFAALRDHAGQTPTAGLRMTMPCAHASWLPTRSAGQTTASMVSHLTPGASRHWLTGTSAPCLSVFKPVPLGTTFAAPPSLWWRAESLHRTVLRDYTPRRATFEPARAHLESTATPATWAEHHALLLDWHSRASHAGRPRRSAYWWYQSLRDGFVGSG